jgi:hypothetical protein
VKLSIKIDDNGLVNKKIPGMYKKCLVCLSCCVSAMQLAVDGYDNYSADEPHFNDFLNS